MRLLSYCNVWAFLFLMPIATSAAIPDSRYQYAADGEYDDLCLVSPWIESKIRKYDIGFKYPKWAEETAVDKRRADTILFNGVIKLAGGNVVGALMLSVFGSTPEFEKEMKLIRSATDEQMKSPGFIKTISSLAGRKDVLEVGMEKVGGLKAFYSTTKIERRVGNQIVYRGVQRVYLIPMPDGKKVVGVNYCLGALGVDEVPYSDYKAFMRVGDKFVRSIEFKSPGRMKFW